MNNRVVVTGMNMITSLGLNISDSWDNLVAGKNEVKKITLFDPSGLQTQIAAQLPDNFEECCENHLKKRSARQMTRATKMSYICAKEAIEDSIIDFEKIDKSRCGVILGTVNTGFTGFDDKYDKKDRILLNMNNAMSAWISIKYGLEGTNYTIATACSSSSFAITAGYDQIKYGMSDIVIVGGADSTINPKEIEGFNELYALSTDNKNPSKASRPFTKDRDGFVIGEGAGVLILESLESAKKRGAKIYAEIAGYANTCEAYNIMAPMKDGEGMAKTMELALKNASIKKEKIDYINAHGTSTTLNDRYETMAIKKVFGEHAYKIPVSSSKSMTGHTIGGAGAIEAIITIMCMKNNLIVPTINYDIPDPDLDLDYVPNKSRTAEINHALSNSFAFGGHNSTIVFKKI